MKKHVIILLLLLLSFNSSSQVWVEDNATWHYDFGGGWSGGFMKLYDNGDTLLAGENSTIIQHDMYQFGFDQFNTLFFIGMTPGGEYYTYSVGDSVFWWTNGGYQLLWDFDAQVNDSWIIDISPAGQYLCDDTSRVRVVDNGIESIQGVNYRYIDLEPVTGALYQMHGRYYERFGGGDFLFPLPYDCDSTIIVDYYLYEGLKCFEDDSLFYNPTSEDCQYYLTQVELGLDHESFLSLQINPNPATDEIQFSGIQAQSVEIVDGSGKIYLSEKVEANQTVNVSSLPSGFYFINCQLIDGHSTIKKLIKK
ncbi:MAG: hypothetical protein ACJAUD_000837 [Crocinitomicaceae bacterium]|jgi:hypothetical protein